MCRTIIQAWRDGDREVETVQLDLKLTSNAKHNHKSFYPFIAAKGRMKKIEQETR